MIKKRIPSILIIMVFVFCFFLPVNSALAVKELGPVTTSDPYYIWTISFNDPMKISTINNQNIYVSTTADGKNRLEGVDVYAADNQHAKVNPPPGGWSFGNTYYIIVTQKVLTTQGLPNMATRMQFRLFNREGIRVYIEDKVMSTDASPHLINGRVLVPMRNVMESTGAVLKWEAHTQTATATKGSNTVVVQIANQTATVNDEEIILDVAPAIIGGRTYVPLRFSAESLGYYVKWDQNTQTAYISKNPFNENDTQ